ncbi:hypothetical protein BDN70DRAFT_170114 [Pholiota conissans]|uniref:Uncharacterized protein n=1 Tax=Pholiota conissans TaxID=109636 RepID=A0A9P5YVJ0_9AGAR|nr:hypothetical protein BDN70DRAFT_170114 [Pholiota conissans]
MPKDKKSAKAKGKQPAAAPPAVGAPRARLPSTNYEASLTAPRHGYVTSKSISLGGDIEANEILSINERQRRRSFGSPLDLVGMEASGAPFHSQSRRRAASQASLSPAPNQMVPFPSGGSVRAPSPGPDHAYGDTGHAHNRTYSSATMGSRFMLDEPRPESHDRQRTFSNDTLGISKPAEDNPFAIQNPSQFSRFDPKAASRARSYSNATMGSRLMPENDAFSVVTEDPYTRERRFSTIELLRPKVLVMPSPLQPNANTAPPEPPKVRDGFELTTNEGPPLPPGARASRRLSTASILDATLSGLVASNSFISTPSNNLTLSQKTFRSTLAFPGQTSNYSDLPTSLPRATEDGEQAVFYPAGKDEGFPIMPVADPNSKTARPAGKLYGKSLIDDLEMRKAQMRSKQRVFTGDQRPSMMARDAHRVSTLIDPATLNARPGNERSSSYGGLSTSPGANLGRHPSLTMKPLITFDGDDEKGLAASPPNANRLQGAKSVFGVDTLWQREMEKLKEIKAAEEKEAEARRKMEEEEERRKEGKKNKRKKKGKGKNEEEETLPVERPASPRVSAEPPTLPTIQRATRRAPPKPTDSDFSSEESDNDDEVPPANANTQGSTVWHSSDEDEGPRRTTGVGLRYPKQSRKMSQSQPARRNDDDSDSDLPLAATIQKARAKLSTASRYGQDDSEDEDKPLSHILKAKSVRSTGSNNNPKPRNFLGPVVADEDEDDEPLGLRASRIPKQMTAGGEDEDDMPLAFHPEQQRKSQFQMLAAAQQQQQQQQQQMMMQAQFQNNMMMSPSMLAPSFYAPPPMMHPMAMMQMMPQMGIPPSPPPIQDDVKFVRVDRWRRDVAVDGEPV